MHDTVSFFPFKKINLAVAYEGRCILPHLILSIPGTDCTLNAGVNSKQTLRSYLCCSPSQELARADGSSKGCPNTNHSGFPLSQELAALENEQIARRSVNQWKTHRKSRGGQPEEKKGRSWGAAFLPCLQKKPAYVTDKQAWHSKFSTAHFFPSSLASLSN